MRKLAIGFLLDDSLDSTDGVQQYVISLGEHYKSQGHAVYYLVGETYRSDLSNIYSLSKNIKVSFNKNKLSIPLPANKKKIHQILQNLKLDVLHVQVPYSPFLAARVINAMGPETKVVGTFHIVPATKLEYLAAKSLVPVIRKSLKRFDAMISVSSAAQEFAKQSFGVSSVVIPNVVSLKQFNVQPQYNDALHIVFLGRLVERKGCQYFLKALHELQARKLAVPYTVTVAGKGPLLQSLEQYKEDKDLSNVTFIGFIDEKDKPALLASADIAVFPSTGGESFGIVLIEAMAAGSRVILGGDNVGYRTVFGNKPELLINPKDAVAFADTLEKYIADSGARSDAFSWAQLEKNQYDVDAVAKRILEVYTK